MNSIKSYESPKHNPTKAVKSILVKDYMMKDPIIFHPEQKLIEVVDYLITKRISGGPVLDDGGNLVGILTEADYMNYISNGAYFNRPLNDAIVKNYMSTKVDTVSTEDSIFDIAALFYKLKRKRFVVMNDNAFAGQITRKDILKALYS